MFIFQSAPGYAPVGESSKGTTSGGGAWNSVFEMKYVAKGKEQTLIFDTNKWMEEIKTKNPSLFAKMQEQQVEMKKAFSQWRDGKITNAQLVEKIEGSIKPAIKKMVENISDEGVKFDGSSEYVSGFITGKIGELVLAKIEEGKKMAGFTVSNGMVDLFVDPSNKTITNTIYLGIVENTLPPSDVDKEKCLLGICNSKSVQETKNIVNNYFQSFGAKNVSSIVDGYLAVIQLFFLNIALSEPGAEKTWKITDLATGNPLAWDIIFRSLQEEWRKEYMRAKGLAGKIAKEQRDFI